MATFTFSSLVIFSLIDNASSKSLRGMFIDTNHPHVQWLPEYGFYWGWGFWLKNAAAPACG
jgi:hypothetical protein